MKDKRKISFLFWWYYFNERLVTLRQATNWTTCKLVLLFKNESNGFRRSRYVYALTTPEHAFFDIVADYVTQIYEK